MLSFNIDDMDQVPLVQQGLFSSSNERMHTMSQSFPLPYVHDGQLYVFNPSLGSAT
jgi:hypothetical protein